MRFIVRKPSLVKVLAWPVYAIIVMFLTVMSAAADFDDAKKAFAAKDYKKAFEQFLPYAQADFPAAQSNIGMMYAQGLGVHRDLIAAAKWWRLAAERGHIPAMYNLGQMYQYEPDLQDIPQAFLWFALAASLGDMPSVGARDRLGAMMTQAQIDEAMKLAAQWEEEGQRRFKEAQKQGRAAYGNQASTTEKSTKASAKPTKQNGFDLATVQPKEKPKRGSPSEEDAIEQAPIDLHPQVIIDDRQMSDILGDPALPPALPRNFPKDQASNRDVVSPLDQLLDSGMWRRHAGNPGKATLALP